jgi:uncharacterized protein (DUF2384 family)
MSELIGIDLELQRLAERAERLVAVRDDLAQNPQFYQPLIDHALRAWGEDEMAWEWLCRPLLRLDYRTPLEAEREGLGEQIRRVLAVVEYGSLG